MPTTTHYADPAARAGELLHLFLNQPDVRTITVGLATLQSARIIPVPMIMAGSILSLLPAVIVYLFFQRQLIAGLTMGMGK